ncbi:MAG: hypothetical protein ACQEQC_06435 [Elusimicrobiota bacterium]
MNTFMVGLPPFAHKSREELYVWTDLLIALLPALGYRLFLTGQGVEFLGILIISAFTFGITGYFKKKKITVKILQSAVTGILIFLMVWYRLSVTGTNRFVIVGGAVLLSIIIYEIIFKGPPVTPFKPVIIAPLLLMKYINSFGPDNFGITVYLYLAGIIYLIFRKRVNLYFILFIALGFLITKLIFSGWAEFNNYLPLFLWGSLLLSYPGVLPLQNKDKGITGLVTGIAISIFGVLGILAGALVGSIVENI